MFKRSKAGGYSVGGHSGSVGGRVKSRLAPRPPPPTEETLRMTFRRVSEDLRRIPDERFIFSKARACRDTFIWNRRAAETNHDILHTNAQTTHCELHRTPCLYLQLYRKQAIREATAGDRHTRQMPRQQPSQNTDATVATTWRCGSCTASCLFMDKKLASWANINISTHGSSLEELFLCVTTRKVIRVAS